nr:dihydrodipicolinate reductase [Tanacetum cinerariifolium]
MKRLITNEIADEWGKASDKAVSAGGYCGDAMEGINAVGLWSGIWPYEFCFFQEPGVLRHQQCSTGQAECRPGSNVSWRELSGCPCVLENSESSVRSNVGVAVSVRIRDQQDHLPVMRISETVTTIVNIVVHVFENAKLYCKSGLPLVIGTTGGDRDLLYKSIQVAYLYTVIYPQMGKQTGLYGQKQQYHSAGFEVCSLLES